MADTGLVVPLVVTFVVVAVVLFVGVSILGSVSTGFSCDVENLGYNSTGTTKTEKYPPGSWSAQCMTIQDSAVSSYSLLIVILIIVAAVAILYVVRTFT